MALGGTVTPAEPPRRLVITGRPPTPYTGLPSPVHPPRQAKSTGCPGLPTRAGQDPAFGEAVFCVDDEGVEGMRTMRV